jgi:hypothetical protein
VERGGSTNFSQWNHRELETATIARWLSKCRHALDLTNFRGDLPKGRGFNRENDDR